MEIFLTVLMVLVILIVALAIIGFVYVAVVSGLFQVIRDRLRRRAVAPRRRAVGIAEEPALQKVTETKNEPYPLTKEV